MSQDGELMANIYNAGQLSTIIKQLCANDVADLGDSDAQDNFIFLYLNLVMQEMPRLAYLVTFSDALAISSNGYPTFLKSSASIANSIFEPLTLLTSTESEVPKRTSYSAPTGWFRETHDLGVHVKGLTAGNYTLKYLRYPSTITLSGDAIEFPTSANATLCKEVVSLIKLSKNSYGGAEYMDKISKTGLGNAMQGAISARGTGSSGQPPGQQDTAIARGV